MESQNDGNGRLWERFELVNINDRIENLYQHFKTVGYGSSELGLDQDQQQHYLDKIRDGISSQLNELLGDLEAKFNEQTKDWKEEKCRLHSDNSQLNQRVRDLNREIGDHNAEKKKLESQYKSLRMGLDQIINKSNAKNKDKIRNLNEKCRQATNERDNAIKQGKKDKKLHRDIVNQMQDKLDNLQNECNKIYADREDLAAERDALAEERTGLEGIIRENRESEDESLKNQLSAVKDELDRIQRDCDKLKRENTKLNEDYRSLQDKYGLEKEAFKKAIEKYQLEHHFRDNEALQHNVETRDAIKKARDDMNRLHQQEIKKREEEWIKAKNDTMKTLDKEYKQLNKDKDKQIDALKNSNQELKQSLQEMKNEIDRLQKENKKLDALREKIQQLNDQIIEGEAKLVELRTELSKYKILWQHFFGFAPLKEEIEKVNTTLDQFEKEHKISSPIPKKKRKVIVESLTRWGEARSPLELEPPPPNDEYQRLELYNIDNKKAIQLKGFRLENAFGDQIPLDSRLINPGACIGVALKKRKTQFDLLYQPTKHSNERRETFCKFAHGEEIWLCDNWEGRVQLFPKTEAIYEDLSLFDRDVGPIYVKQFYNEDDGYRGFEFGNNMKKKIKLKNMFFKSKKGSLRVPIPYKALPVNGVIRLIISNDRRHPKIKANDLLVAPSDIQHGDDSLLLCDQYGNSRELYNLQVETGIEIRSDDDAKKDSTCFIM